MIDILDAMVRITCVIISIRALCILARMWGAKWSIFSVPVLGMAGSAGYIVVHGAADKAVTYPLVIVIMCMLNILDKRQNKKRGRH